MTDLLNRNFVNPQPFVEASALSRPDSPPAATAWSIVAILALPPLLSHPTDFPASSPVPDSKPVSSFSLACTSGLSLSAPPPQPFV